MLDKRISLEESWNLTLNDWCRNGMISEGLFTHDKEAGQDKNDTEPRLTGKGAPRSFLKRAATSLANGVAKLTFGDDYEKLGGAIEGGLFDKKTNNGTRHKEAEKELAQRCRNLIAIILNSALNAYLIMEKCVPTKFIKNQEINGKMCVQLRKVNENMTGNNHDISKGANDGISFDGEQELMEVKREINICINQDFGKERKTYGYAWLLKHANSAFQLFAEPNLSLFNSVQMQLNNIDTQINRYLYQRSIQTNRQAQTDPTVIELLEQKLEVVTKAFDRIQNQLENIRDNKQYQLVVTNNGIRYFDLNGSDHFSDIKTPLIDFVMVWRFLNNVERKTLDNFNQSMRNRPTT